MDQATSSFSCLIGDKFLKMDGSESFNGATIVAGKGTNCFMEQLWRMLTCRECLQELA